MQTYPETYQFHIDRTNHPSELHINTLNTDFEIISDSKVIERILECIDPYYNKYLDANTVLGQTL